MVADPWVVEAADHFGGVTARRIVHDDKLEIGEGLPEQGFECTAERIRPVERRHAKTRCGYPVGCAVHSGPHPYFGLPDSHPPSLSRTVDSETAQNSPQSAADIFMRLNRTPPPNPCRCRGM